MPACSLFLLLSLQVANIHAQPTQMSSGWYWPTTTSPYDTCDYLGWLSPNPSFNNDKHLAQDICNPQSEPVYSIGSGEIVYSRTDVDKYGPGMTDGGAIVARYQAADGSWFTVLYGHLDSPHAVGDIGAGDIVGYSNAVDFPHLHLGIHLGYYPEPTNPWRGYTNDTSETYGFTDPLPFLNDHPAVSVGKLTDVNDGPEKYWLQNNQVYHVSSASVLTDMQNAGMPGWRWDSIDSVSNVVFSSYEEGPDFITSDNRSDGLLVRQRGEDKVYLVENGRRRWIRYAHTLNWLGEDSFPDVIEVPSGFISHYALGDAISHNSVGLNALNASIESEFQQAYIDNATEAHCIPDEPHPGWPGSYSKCLGFPTGTVQTGYPSGASEITGYFQAFKNEWGNGATINSSARGTFAVHGAIYKKYAEMQFSKSYLGFPTSDEYDWASGRRSDFEGGYIYWDSTTNQTIASVPPQVCTYELRSTFELFSSTGGSSSFEVITQAGCGLTASTSTEWISVALGPVADGRVMYSVQENLGTSERIGTITVQGQSATLVFNVEQDGFHEVLPGTVENPYPVLIVPGIMGSASSQIHPALSDNDTWKLIQDIDEIKIDILPNLVTRRDYNELYKHLDDNGYTPIGPMNLDTNTEVTEWDPELNEWMFDGVPLSADANLFPAPYDWRQSNSVTYKNFLMKQIDKARAISGAPKVNIVAHSMGGLVARAYIQSDEYAVRNDVDQLIMLGTPNAGSAKAYYVWAEAKAPPGDLIAYTYLISRVIGCQPYDRLCVQREVPSVRELLPDRDLTNYGGYLWQPIGNDLVIKPYSVLSLENQNDFLTDLNDNLDDLSESRVHVTVFGGSDGGNAEFNTIANIRVNFTDCPKTLVLNGLYVDGCPDGYSRSSGDGTVLVQSLSANGNLKIEKPMKKAEHDKLPTAYKKEILEALKPLRVSFEHDVAMGQHPGYRSVRMTATASGDFQTFNYTFWWDCQDPGTKVADVMTCGSIPTPTSGECSQNEFGKKCDGVSDSHLPAVHDYLIPGTYTAKVIVEAGTISVEKRINIDVTGYCTDAYEDNDSTASAWGPLFPGVDESPKICSTADVDWFYLSAPGPGKISLSMTPPAAADYNLSLYGPSGIQLRHSGLGTGLNEGITYNARMAGTYYVKVEGVDGSHNSSIPYTLSYSFATDTVDPTVNIIAPTPDSTWDATATPLIIGGFAQDDEAIVSVSWANDRGGGGIADGKENWSASVSLSAGANQITVTATDWAGNEATDTLAITFNTMDTVGPTIGITSPTSNSSYTATSGSLSLSGWAADSGTGVSHVICTNHRGGPLLYANGITSWSFAGIQLYSGINVITITAYDGSGNTQVDTLTVTFTPPDAVPPTVAITAPTSAGTYSTSNSPLVIRGTAWDDVGVSRVEYWGANGSGTASGTMNWTAKVALSPGVNTIYVNAWDTAGHGSGSAVLLVTYTPPDTSGPTVTIEVPTPSPTYETTANPITLEGTASDAVGVTEVTWSNDRGGSDSASGTTNWTASGVVLQSGANVLTVTARDPSGNTGVDTLTINYTPPESGNIVWVSKMPVPSASRAPGASAVVNGKIYVMGTDTHWRNYEYDPGTDTWLERAPAPGGVTDGAAAVVDGKIYTVGTRWLSYKLRIYDPSTNSWTESPGGVPRDWPAMAVVNGKIYVIGGQDDSGFSSTVEEYDPILETWTLRSPMPTARAYTAVAVMNDLIYVFGGSNNSRSADNTLEIYNPASNTWTSISQEIPHTWPPFSEMRRGHAAAAVNGKIYVFGGRRYDDLSLVEEYDPELNQWRVMNSLNTPRFLLASGVVDGKIYAIGGSNATGGLTSVEEGTIAPDITVPEVTITSPTSDSTYSTNIATLNLGGSSLDNVKVVQVNWSNDRGGSGTAPGTTNWSVSGIALQLGQNVITVTAHDQVGNIGTDTVKVDYSVAVTPTLDSFQINEGGVLTESRTVFLDNTTANLPTEYLVSEEPSFTGATWLPYSSSPPFMLSPGNGNKTVYMKVRNAAGESTTLSSSIYLEASSAGVNFFSPFTLVDGADAQNHKLAVDTSGNIYVLFETPDLDLFLVKSIDGGATFGAPVTIPGGHAGNGFDLDVDSSDNLHVVWDGSGADIYYSKSTDGGANFAAPVSLRTGSPHSGYRTTGGSNPRVGSGDGGILYVVFGATTLDATDTNLGNNIWVAKSVDWGESFGPEFPIHEIGNNQTTPIEISVLGSEYYILYRDGAFQLHFAYGNSSSLLPLSPAINEGLGDPWSGDIVVAPNGTSIYVAFEVNVSNVPPGYLYFCRSTDTGENWDECRVVVSSDKGARNPDLALDNFGALHVVWQDYQGPQQTYYSFSTDGGTTFAFPVNVFSDTSTSFSHPRLALDIPESLLYLSASMDSHQVVLTRGSYAPDPSPPTIAITAPTSDATYETTSNSLALGGMASDEVGVVRVSWSNDRGGAGDATGTTNWSVSDIALQPGNNIITVTAWDESGNRGSNTLTVNYTAPDTTAPSITITSPTSDSSYIASSGTIVLEGQASDNVAVAEVRWSSNLGLGGIANGTTNWAMDPIAVQNGINVITLTAFDAAGNMESDVLTVTYTAPSSTPTIVVTQPTSGATYATDDVDLTLSGVAADDVGVTEVTWQNDRGGTGTATGAANWTVSDIPLQEGSNVITVTAYDADGHSQSDTITVTRGSRIQVVSPNGGEDLAAGAIHEISWTSANLNPNGLIYIFYWYGGAWQQVAQLAPETISYNWVTPDTQDESVGIWIGNWVNGEWEASDGSDASFRIGPPQPMQIVADFGDKGLWHFDPATTWTKLTSWDPGTLVAWEDKVAVAFGSGRGLWTYDTSGWEKLTSWDPEGIVAWGNKLAADFGATRGLWLYESTGWTKITTWEPERIIALGGKLVADFGAGRGIWVYESSTWNRISGWDPYDLVAWGNKLVAAFESGRGVWTYDAVGGWNRTTTWEPVQMVAWSDKLAVDYGARGLWVYDTSWIKITSWNPEDMFAWGDKLAGDFGGRGLWLYSSTGWAKITSWDPEQMEAMADQLAADFGSGRGLWLYETSWTKITSWDPESLETVR